MKVRLIAEGSTQRERKTLRWGVSFLVGGVLFDAFGRADIFWENVRRHKIGLSRVRLFKKAYGKNDTLLRECGTLDL